MKDTFKIVWSKRAYNNLAKIIRYLEENWTEKEIGKFAGELDRSIEIIKKNPLTFHSSNRKPSLRKVVITKHNTLYYKIEGQTIKLVTVFDTRQDPKKI
jgi:plasmid stabilization system protein ParE